MALYMLDTDISSYIMKRSNAALLLRIREVPLSDQALSVVSLAELLFGTRLSSQPRRAGDALKAFVAHLRVIDWNHKAAEHYADVRADLQKRGEMIGSNDLLIAAHARSLGATLVSNNVREFRRVRGLSVENWAV